MNTRTAFALLAVGGLAGGIANGLLGAGGGIIITFVLERVLPESEMPRRDIFANVIAVSLPISVLSSVIYALHGNINADSFGKFVIPAVVGGLIGAYLLSKINTVLLKRIFALIVIWSGVYMLLR